MPDSLPRNTRPPNTVGCALTALTPGMPNAHFNVSFGTDCAVSPAAAADWNRELVRSLPHPFHCGSVAASASGRAGVVQRPAAGSGGDSRDLRQERGDRGPLDRRHAGRHRRHRAAGRERGHDRLAAERGERGAQRRPRRHLIRPLVVAGGAALPVERRAGTSEEERLLSAGHARRPREDGGGEDQKGLDGGRATEGRGHARDITPIRWFTCWPGWARRDRLKGDIGLPQFPLRDPTPARCSATTVPTLAARFRPSPRTCACNIGRPLPRLGIDDEQLLSRARHPLARRRLASRVDRRGSNGYHRLVRHLPGATPPARPRDP